MFQIKITEIIPGKPATETTAAEPPTTVERLTLTVDALDVNRAIAQLTAKPRKRAKAAKGEK